VLGQGNMVGDYSISITKNNTRLATARLRKNNVDTLRRLHLCARTTTAKPPRGIAKRVLPMRCSQVIPGGKTEGKIDCRLHLRSMEEGVPMLFKCPYVESTRTRRKRHCRRGLEMAQGSRWGSSQTSLNVRAAGNALTSHSPIARPASPSS
jgi:hypothetical protein